MKRKVEVRTFCLGEDEVKVHYWKVKWAWWWMLEVNGHKSTPRQVDDTMGILCHAEWYVAWQQPCYFDILKPFKITYGNRHIKG